MDAAIKVAVGMYANMRDERKNDREQSHPGGGGRGRMTVRKA